MSRRRRHQLPASPDGQRVSPGYGEQHAKKVECGTREVRLRGGSWSQYSKPTSSRHRTGFGRSEALPMRWRNCEWKAREAVITCSTPTFATIIKRLNPVLQGWGGYFRTGNAATKFNAIDRHVERRLRGLLLKRKGRHLKPGESAKWNRDFFKRHGLVQLSGRIKYPGAA